MRAPTEPAPLKHYATERLVPPKFDQWRKITAWQRKGFVRMRWADNGQCWISLTDAGRAEVGLAPMLPGDAP